MRILLTGAGGFLGTHVLRLLGDLDDIHLTLLEAPDAQLPDGMRRIRCDITDQEMVTATLRGRKYDLLLHLACLAEERDYARLQAVNALGTRNLMMALENRVSRAIISGSSSVYGDPMGEEALDELSYVDPSSGHGRSMAAREALAREMAGLYGTEICILRLFDLAGPGQSPAALIPSLARKLVMIRLGQTKGEVAFRGLESRRDYVDVRDAARAVIAAVLHRGRLPERMNIATGRAWSGRQILDAMARSISVDPPVEGAGRDSAATVVRGDPSTAEKTLGWKAEVPMARTLADVLKEWLTRLRPSPCADR